jgi:hypothetical protein
LFSSAAPKNKALVVAGLDSLPVPARPALPMRKGLPVPHDGGPMFEPAQRLTGYGGVLPVPAASHPLLNPQVRDEIARVAADAKAKGWSDGALWNMERVGDEPRGLASLMNPGDKILDVRPDFISVQKRLGVMKYWNPAAGGDWQPGQWGGNDLVPAPTPDAEVKPDSATRTRAVERTVTIDLSSPVDRALAKLHRQLPRGLGDEQRPARSFPLPKRDPLDARTALAKIVGARRYGIPQPERAAEPALPAVLGVVPGRIA